MKKSSPVPNPARPGTARSPAGADSRTRPADLQPPATGAKRGSPTAPVMKQFAKTQAESGGRS